MSDEEIRAEIDRRLAEPPPPGTVRLRLSDLPESVLQLLATKTRHPQCLITKDHPSHRMWRASTSGIECGGAPKPPRP